MKIELISTLVLANHQETHYSLIGHKPDNYHNEGRKTILPEKALLIEPDGLKQLSYYAGAKHKMWASQTSEELLEQLAEKENAFLLVNFRDGSHTAAFLPIKDKLEYLDSLEPVDKKFELKLYRLKKE